VGDVDVTAVNVKPADMVVVVVVGAVVGLPKLVEVGVAFVVVDVVPPVVLLPNKKGVELVVVVVVVDPPGAVVPNENGVEAGARAFVSAVVGKGLEVVSPNENPANFGLSVVSMPPLTVGGGDPGVIPPKEMGRVGAGTVGVLCGLSSGCGTYAGFGPPLKSGNLYFSISAFGSSFSSTGGIIMGTFPGIWVGEVDVIIPVVPLAGAVLLSPNPFRNKSADIGDFLASESVELGFGVTGVENPNWNPEAEECPEEVGGWTPNLN